MNETQSPVSFFFFFALSNDFYPVCSLKKKQAKSDGQKCTPKVKQRNPCQQCLLTLSRSPRGGDAVGSSSLFFQSAGQEEGEFCFMRRASEESSSFLLFKVRKEKVVRLEVGVWREVTGEGCTFPLALWAPSTESHHLAVKTRKTSFLCFISSCWPRSSPFQSAFGTAGVCRCAAIPPVGQFAALGWSSKCACLMSGSLRYCTSG